MSSRIIRFEEIAMAESAIARIERIIIVPLGMSVRVIAECALPPIVLAVCVWGQIHIKHLNPNTDQRHDEREHDCSNDHCRNVSITHCRALPSWSRTLHGLTSQC